MNRYLSFIVVAVLFIVMLLPGCISQDEGSAVECEQLEDDYEELQDDYEVLSESYEALQSDYQDLYDRCSTSTSTPPPSSPPWEDHVTYYRVTFGDEYEDYYFWQYSSYSYLGYWKDKERTIPRGYPVDSGVLNDYVVYDHQWTLIDSISEEIEKLSQDRTHYAKLALAFVHNAIYYMTDEESTGVGEYWKYPDETLFDKVGDCEDTTFLYASLLRARGIPAIIIEYEDHLAVGVGLPTFSGTYYEYDGTKYYFAETTSNMFDEDRERDRDFRIGECPEGLDEAYLHEVQ